MVARLTMCSWSLSCIQLFVTPWTVACQAPLSMGILQARIPEWVAMPSSRGSSQPRDQTQVSCTAGRFFTSWVTRKPKNTGVGCLSLLQRIFPTQELNQGLLHCRQILYQWVTREALRILKWVAVSSSRGSSKPRDWTRSSTLQMDSLLSEPPGKPVKDLSWWLFKYQIAML